jgi:hypothetical protein
VDIYFHFLIRLHGVVLEKSLAGVVVILNEIGGGVVIICSSEQCV